MRIRTLEGLLAQCEAKGVERSVNLLMLQHESLAPGDYLVVHLGYGTQKITEVEAQAAWAVYDELLAADPGGG
jgi:hydrogenase expression/formation protein HypC